MPTQKVKAILFDLGETLLTFGKVNVYDIFLQSAHLTYDYLREQHQDVPGFSLYYLKNLISLRWNYLLSSLTGNDFNSIDLLKKVNMRKGISLTDQQWQHLAWLWYEPLSKCAKIEPDIARSLQTLQDMQIKLGIVSNTFVHETSLDRHLRQIGILDFFQFRLYSYELRFRKPDHRIFDAAASKIGEIPENIIFVGDRVDNDIKPAMRVGMHAVLKDAYTNVGKKTPIGAYRIKYISELPAVAEKINKG